MSAPQVVAGVRVPGASAPGAGTASPGRRLDQAAYLAVCVLFATVPWQDVVQVAGVGTVAKTVGVGVVAVCALALLVGGGLRRPGESLCLLLAYSAWVFLSPLWSSDPATSLLRAATMVQLVVMVLVTVHVVSGWSRFAGLLAAFVVGDVILGATVLAQRLEGATLVRYTAEGTNPNDVAFLMCLGVPMAWYLVLRGRRTWLRVLFAAFPLLAVTVVVLTASRSALLLLVPALAIVPLTLRRLPSVGRAMVGLVALAASLAVLSGGLLPSAPLQRLGTTLTELQSGTLDNRTTIWGVGLGLFGQHPLIGVGAGTVPEYVGRSYPLQAGLHNTYLSVAVQFGVVGLVLFGLMLVSVVRRAIAVAQPERVLAATLSVLLVFGLLPRHWEFTKGTWAVVAILLCVAALGRLRTGAVTPSGSGDG